MSQPHTLRLSPGRAPCLASREAHSSRDPHTHGLRYLATAAVGATAAATPAAALAPPPPAGGYQLPPPEIKAIIDAPSEPLLSFSPDRTMLLELERPPPLPPVSELSRPELKLAGAPRHAAQCSAPGPACLRSTFSPHCRNRLLSPQQPCARAHKPPAPPPLPLQPPAGLRIDPAAFGRSRMLSYYTSLRVAPFTDDLVLPLSAGLGRSITGIPEGYWCAQGSPARPGRGGVPGYRRHAGGACRAGRRW
jgi:hypothetical protein